MPIEKKLENEINGFKIIKDLGREKNDIRYALVICKECKKEFKTSVYHINVIKSCGCLPCRTSKNLPNFINGFKILEDYGYSNGSRRALAICKECKEEYKVDPNKLKYRNHCGCKRKNVIASKYAKSHPRLNNTYKHMLSRCYNPNNQDYYLYGKRGIRVCKEWKNDRNKFFEWALKNGYMDDLSIDRIDNSKGYNPQNCKWSNSSGQARNTRRNVLNMDKANEIRSLQGKYTIYELAGKFNVSEATIWLVLNNRTWMD